MEKNIYGIIDVKTGNFGDICILDRDEEFLDGVLKLFLNTDVPKYIVEDLIAVRYGSISYNSKRVYPKFCILKIPTIILSGRDVLSLRDDYTVPVVASDDEAILTDGDDDDEEIFENS